MSRHHPNTPTSQLNTSPSTEPLSTPYPTFRTAYGPKLRVALTFPEQGREKQSFKDECDINNIMRRFQVTGEVTHLNQRPPMFGEVPDIDFAGAMSIVVDARERFQQLPATIRDRFNNDPGRLLEFIQNPDNREEGIRLGILQAPQATATPPAAPPPVSPTGAPPAAPASAS